MLCAIYCFNIDCRWTVLRRAPRRSPTPAAPKRRSRTCSGQLKTKLLLKFSHYIICPSVRPLFIITDWLFFITAYFITAYINLRRVKLILINSSKSFVTIWNVLLWIMFEERNPKHSTQAFLVMIYYLVCCVYFTTWLLFI